jgi:hypothetical protein
MASLQDQLLKAGLTTKQKAQQANSDKRKKKKQQRSGVKVEASLQEQVKQDLAKIQAEKLAKDAELNALKKKQLEQKELQLRIQQILTHHQVKDIEGEIAYNFTHQNKVKKLFVNEKSQTALIKGRLSICALQDTIYVVTAETAEKVKTLDESVVLLLNDKVTEEETAEDDPYAEFQIPDDLMW